MKRILGSIVLCLLLAARAGGQGAGVSTDFVPKGDVVVLRNNRVVSVFNASADTDAARGAALVAAFAASSANETIRCHANAFTVSTQLALKDHQTIELNGARITAGTNLVGLFLISGLTRATLKGPATLTGTANFGAGTETAVIVRNCARARVEDIDAYNWGGVAFDWQPDTTAPGAAYVNGHYANLFANNCAIGFRTQAKNEYSFYSQLYAHACTLGFDLCGGNNLMTALAAVHGSNGFYFRGGDVASNHHHSYINGLTANHNTGYSVTFGTGLNQGLTISNFVAFANNAVSGQVIFDTCENVSIDGGELCAPISFTATPTGRSTINRMMIASQPIGGTIAATPAQRRMLRITRCFDATGPWSGNDPVEAADGGTGATTLASGQIPHAWYPSGRLQGSNDATRNPFDGLLSFNGPVNWSTNATGGRTGSFVITAGDNTQIPFVLRGKADTTSPAVHPQALSPVVWYRAGGPGMNYRTGETVTTLTDLSGNNRTATYGAGGTATTPPVYVENAVNGKAAIRYAGSVNQGHVSTSFAQAQAFTLFVVLKTATEATNATVFYSNSGNITLYNPVSGGIRMYAGADGQLTLTNTNWNVISYVVNGASSSGRVNNQSSPVTTNIGSSGISGGVTIGTYISGAAPWTGDLAELLVVSGALSNTAREGVAQYLASQYGITITQGTSGASTVQTADTLQLQLPSGTAVSGADPEANLFLGSFTTTTRDALAKMKAGSIIFNSTTGKLNYYNGTAWQSVTTD